MNVLSDRDHKFQKKRRKRQKMSGGVNLHNKAKNLFWKIMILLIIIVLGYLASPYAKIWYEHITTAIE